MNVIGTHLHSGFQCCHNTTARGIFVKMCGSVFTIGVEVGLNDNIWRYVVWLINLVPLALGRLRHGRDERVSDDATH